MKQATLILAIAFLGATACQKKDVDEDKTGTTRTTSGQPANEQGDNTRMNQRDRAGNTLTPGDQAQGTDADRAATALIRRTVMSDDKLSPTAKNVKIITIDNVVTLRGPVKTQEEKDSIAEKARKAPGVKSVDNQLEVTGQ